MRDWLQEQPEGERDAAAMEVLARDDDKYSAFLTTEGANPKNPAAQIFKAKFCELMGLALATHKKD